MSFKKEGMVHSGMFILFITIFLLFLLCFNVYSGGGQGEVTSQVVAGDGLTRNALVTKINHLVFNPGVADESVKMESGRVGLLMDDGSETGKTPIEEVIFSFRMR